MDTTKSVSYTYDELNRLKTAESNGTQWGLTWTYDRYGNRISQSATKGTPPTNSLTVDTATNRVTGWTYEATGNVTHDGRNTYAYDAENRIISIGSGTTTYSYDAFGARVQKTTGAQQSDTSSVWRRTPPGPGRSCLFKSKPSTRACSLRGSLQSGDGHRFSREPVIWHILSG